MEDHLLNFGPGEPRAAHVLFLVFAEGPTDASPIERITDFRTGFLDGYAACEALV